MADFFAKKWSCTSVKEAVSGTTLSTKAPNSYVERFEKYLQSADRAEHLDGFICQLSTNDTRYPDDLGIIMPAFITGSDAFDTATTFGAMEYIIAKAKETWDCPVYFYTNPPYSNAGALEASFAPGCVNTDLWKFYKTAGFKRENAKLSGGSPDQYRINEVPWEKYSDALKSTFANYGDVALVVLSRSSGEGADLPSGLDALKPYMTDGDYLRLCKEELDLLSNLTTLKSDGIFKKIVVLLNSSSTLQLDFIDDYDIDAVLWVGNLGPSTASASSGAVPTAA